MVIAMCILTAIVAAVVVDFFVMIMIAMNLAEADQADRLRQV